MTIWVDADACPKAIKAVLFRAAERRRIRLALVANRALWTPRSPWIRSIEVPRGFDVADERILGKLAPGDLVITADVPLAAEVLRRGGHALDPRGEAFTPDNIGDRAAVRDLMQSLRDTGWQGGGPPALGEADVRAFANGLDRLLGRHAEPTG